MSAALLVLGLAAQAAQVPAVATATSALLARAEAPLPPVDGFGVPSAPLPDPDADRSLLLQPELSLLASLGSEWDSNAPRAVVGTSSSAAPGDALVRLLADLRARFFVTRRDVLMVRYVVGMKRFFGQEVEDLLVHDLDGSASIGLFDGLDLRLSGRYRASRIRSQDRDYTLTSVGAGAHWRPLELLRVTAEGRLDTLDFPPACLLSYQGPAVRGSVDLYPVEELEVGAFGGFTQRTYQGLYTGAPVALCSERTDRRRDDEPHLGVHGTYRGAFIAGLEVTGRFSSSNDPNEDIERFRAAAFATVPLPLELVLNVQGALQFNRGTSLTGALRPEDDENQNSFEVQLARPLFGGLDVVVRYSVYANEFATAAAEFTRHTVYAGLTFETGVR